MLKSVYGATKEIKHALTFKTSFYTVPKAAGAEVPPALFAKWVVPEEKVKQAAESGDVEFDFNTFWVVDQSCPREKLGMGVSTITLSLASSTRVQRDTGASSSAPQAHAPAPQAHAPAPQAPAEVPLAQGAAKQAQNDATSPQASENEVILKLIKNANTASLNGKFWSADQNDSNTVEFWARMVSSALLDMKNKFGDQLPEGGLWAVDGPFGKLRNVFRRFPKFLSDLLMERGTVSSLHRFSAADVHVRATGAMPLIDH